MAFYLFPRKYFHIQFHCLQKHLLSRLKANFCSLGTPLHWSVSLRTPYRFPGQLPLLTIWAPLLQEHRCQRRTWHNTIRRIQDWIASWRGTLLWSSSNQLPAQSLSISSDTTLFLEGWSKPLTAQIRPSFCQAPKTDMVFIILLGTWSPGPSLRGVW